MRGIIRNQTTLGTGRTAAGLLALLLTASPAAAQVGDVSAVNLPGWQPLDRVVPTVTTTVAYDSAAGTWRYDYVLANGAEAEQAIESFDLRFNAPDTEARLTVPAGWEDMLAPPPYAEIPGAGFYASPPDELAGAVTVASPAQLPPGESLSGFRIVSRYPPGYARAYIQGFASAPYLAEEDIPAPLIVPHDTTNSQRRWALGPTHYTEVLTTGTTEVVNANGFLGFMNLQAAGTTLMDPAPVALKISVNGETVFPRTFQATLNGSDVTAAFFPGTTDGAELVAVFALADSPLRVGDNVLEASIRGVLPGRTTEAVDADIITFSVVP